MVHAKIFARLILAMSIFAQITNPVTASAIAWSDIIDFKWHKENKEPEISADVPSPNVTNVIDVTTTLDKDFRIATGPYHTPAYAAGSFLCLNFNYTFDKLGMHCQNTPSQDFIGNIDLLRQGKVAFALSYSNLDQDIVNNNPPFSNTNNGEQIRHVLYLYDSSFTIIVKTGSDINSFDGLQNKIINIPADDHNASIIMNKIIADKKWNEKSFRNITNLDESQQQNALCNGNIDAIIMMASHPNDDIYKISQTCQIDILDLSSEPLIQRMVASNNGYYNNIVPGGHYFGIVNNVQTLGVKATILADADTDNSTVYKICSIASNYVDKLRLIHSSFGSINKNELFAEPSYMPFHNGVLGYLRDNNKQDGAGKA